MLNAVRITTRLAGMTSPLTTADKAWIDDSDCALDDFEAQVLRDTDLADYPHAAMSAPTSRCTRRPRPHAPTGGRCRPN